MIFSIVFNSWRKGSKFYEKLKGSENTSLHCAMNLTNHFWTLKLAASLGNLSKYHYTSLNAISKNGCDNRLLLFNNGFKQL